MSLTSLDTTPEATATGAARTVVVIDDHIYVRRGLRRLVDAEPDLTVVGEAADAEQGLALIERRRPAVAVVDIRLRGTDGLELVRTLVERGLETRPLIVTLQERSFFAERARAAGALGYVSKHERPAKIIRAIRHLLAGQEFFGD